MNIHGLAEKENEDGGSIVKLEVPVRQREDRVVSRGFSANRGVEVGFFEDTVADRNRWMRFHCALAPPPLQLWSSGDS